jgi:hypothetical protein
LRKCNRSDYYDGVGQAENKVTRECWKWLNEQGWYCWRNNSTGVWDARAGGYRRPPPECINGVSDLIAFREGNTIFVECKSAKGDLSKDQRLFKNQCEKHGVRYITAHSLKELKEKMK